MLSGNAGLKVPLDENSRSYFNGPADHQSTVYVIYIIILWIHMLPTTVWLLRSENKRLLTYLLWGDGSGPAFWRRLGRDHCRGEDPDRPPRSKLHGVLGPRGGSPGRPWPAPRPCPAPVPRHQVRPRGAGPQEGVPRPPPPRDTTRWVATILIASIRGSRFVSNLHILKSGILYVGSGKWQRENPRLIYSGQFFIFKTICLETPYKC